MQGFRVLVSSARWSRFVVSVCAVGIAASVLAVAGGCETRYRRGIVELQVDEILSTNTYVHGELSQIGFLLNYGGHGEMRDTVQTWICEYRKLDGHQDAATRKKQLLKRNMIMHSMLTNIQAYWDSNYDDIYEGRASADTLIDFAVLGFSGAGAFAGEASSRMFSAISGGLVGAKASVDANFFNDANKFLVIQKMRAIREAQLTKIYENMTKSTVVYSLEQGASDLYALMLTGPIRDAVAEEAAEATVELDAVLQRRRDAERLLDEFMNSLLDE